MPLEGVSVRSQRSSLRRSASDPAAFDDVYRRHSRAVVVFLTRRTYDAEVALDLTAETFAQALKGCHRFRGETADDERAWLIAIAKHLHAQYVRKGVAESRAVRRLGLQLPRPDAAELARVIELAGGAELRAAVAAQLEALNADQRTAVHLRVVEELPYPEIAARLGVSEQTVRARVSRGLRTIAAELERRQIPTEPEPAR